MAEALALVGLASSIVTFVEFGRKLGTRLREIDPSRSAFAGIASQLPLLIQVVTKLEKDLEATVLSTNVERALSRTVEGCLRQVQTLDELVEKSLPNLDDSTFKRTRRALGSIRNDKKVSEIQRTLETYKTTLILHLSQLSQPEPQDSKDDGNDGICDLPPYRVSHFVGREELLSQIGSILGDTVQKLSNKGAAVVLIGMGGEGKTQIAIEYCRREKAKNNSKPILWIDATSPATVAQGYESIAERTARPCKTFSDSDDKINYLKELLGCWKSPWLMVLDNFDRPDTFNIQDYLPQEGYGQFLFTSRHTDAGRLGHIISVGNMTESESLDLLFWQTRLERSAENLTQSNAIVKRLGYFPLAIDQAGSYIRSRRLPLESFEEHFNNRKEFILKHVPKVWDYRRRLSDKKDEISLSALTSWELSFEQIGTDDEDRAKIGHLLSLSAFFDSTSLTEDIFQRHVATKPQVPEWAECCMTEGVWDHFKFQDTAAGLLSLSLLQGMDFESKELSFSLHPLIRDWIRLRLNQEERKQFTVEAIKAITASLENISTIGTSLPYQRIMLSHMDASMENDNEIFNTKPCLGVGPLRYHGALFASFYEFSARYILAEILYRRVLEDQTNEFGELHQNTLKTVMDVANVNRNLGRLQEAGVLYEQALKTRETLSGADHEDTLRAVEGLAIIEASQEHYSKAEVLFKRILVVREAQTGADDSTAVRVIEGLANVYRLQGKFSEAEVAYGRTLEQRFKTVGPYHLDTLRSLEGLAIVYRNQGRLKEAIFLYGEVLEGLKDQFDPNHPFVLRPTSNLVIAYMYDERNEEAETLSSRIVEGYKASLGNSHPDTYRALEQLSDIRSILGKQTAAGYEPEEVSATNRAVRGTMQPTAIHDHSEPLVPQRRSMHDSEDPCFSRRPVYETERAIHKRMKEPPTSASYDLQGSLFIPKSSFKSGGSWTRHLRMACLPSVQSERYSRPGSLQLLSLNATKVDELAEMSYISPKKWKASPEDFPAPPRKHARTTAIPYVDPEGRDAYELELDLARLSDENRPWHIIRGEAEQDSSAIETGRTYNNDSDALKTIPMFDSTGSKWLSSAATNRDYSTSSEYQSLDDDEELHGAASTTLETLKKSLRDHYGLDPKARSCKNDYPDLAQRRQTQLSKAAQNGDSYEVKMLLDLERFEKDAHSGQGFTPLTYAAIHGHESVVALLLQHKSVNPNSKDGEYDTPLHHAVMFGHESIVALLLQHKTVDPNLNDMAGLTPLHHAVFDGQEESIVALLLQHKTVDPNSKDMEDKTPLHHVVSHSQKSTVALLLQHETVDPNSKDWTGRTPLHDAVFRGHESIVALLLQHKTVDPNSRDMEDKTPLHHAVVHGHESIVALLLQHETVDPNSKNRIGWTPLHFAVINSHESIVALLLQHKTINPNSKDKIGSTPLHFAVFRGRESIVALLLQHKTVDPNSKGMGDKTPLHHAVVHSHESTVAFLLQQKNVDPNSKDKESKTPLHYAVTYNRMAIMNMLLNVKNIDVNSKDSEGNTPLIWAPLARNRGERALANGAEEVVKQLLSAEAIDVNAHNTIGVSALMAATLLLEIQIARLLLNHSAIDPNLATLMGATPLFEAAKIDNTDLVRMLLDAGANPTLFGPPHVTIMSPTVLLLIEEAQERWLSSPDEGSVTKEESMATEETKGMEQSTAMEP